MNRGHTFQTMRRLKKLAAIAASKGNTDAAARALAMRDELKKSLGSKREGAGIQR
jgi:hypothetical protein